MVFFNTSPFQLPSPVALLLLKLLQIFLTSSAVIFFFLVVLLLFGIVMKDLDRCPQMCP